MMKVKKKVKQGKIYNHHSRANFKKNKTTDRAKIRMKGHLKATVKWVRKEN